jgi:hypothetical protein
MVLPPGNPRTIPVEIQVADDKTTEGRFRRGESEGRAPGAPISQSFHKSLFENPPGEGTGPTKMAKLGDFL